MDELKQYEVTVKVFLWAEDAEDAVGRVVNELNYLCSNECDLAGFQHPTLKDVIEDKEI